MTPCLNSSSCCSKQVEIIRSCCSKHLSCNATLPGPSAGPFQRLEPAQKRKYRVFCHGAGAARSLSRPRADRGIPGLVVIDCGAPGVYCCGQSGCSRGVSCGRRACVLEACTFNVFPKMALRAIPSLFPQWLTYAGPKRSPQTLLAQATLPPQ